MKMTIFYPHAIGEQLPVTERFIYFILLHSRLVEIKDFIVLS